MGVVGACIKCAELHRRGSIGATREIEGVKNKTGPNRGFLESEWPIFELRSALCSCRGHVAISCTWERHFGVSKSAEKSDARHQVYVQQQEPDRKSSYFSQPRIYI